MSGSITREAPNTQGETCSRPDAPLRRLDASHINSRTPRRLGTEYLSDRNERQAPIVRSALFPPHFGLLW